MESLLANLEELRGEIAAQRDSLQGVKAAGERLEQALRNLDEVTRWIRLVLDEDLAESSEESETEA